MIAPLTDPLLDRAAGLIRDSRAGLAFTGAGISVESGIPHFRGAGGLWTQFDPYKVASIGEFRRDPAQYWTYSRNHRRTGAAPNPAHLALVDLQRAGHLRAVITQNTDGLHQKAGSTDVIELHGSSHAVECLDCERTYPRDRIDQLNRQQSPPLCPGCGGRFLKPTVVLFGESLPAQPLQHAQALAEAADLVLIVAARYRSIRRPAFRGWLGSMGLSFASSTPSRPLSTEWPRSSSTAARVRCCLRSRPELSRLLADRERLAAGGADHGTLAERCREQGLAGRAGVVADAFQLALVLRLHRVWDLAQVHRRAATLRAAIQRRLGRPVLEIAAKSVDEHRGVPQLEAIRAAPVGTGEEHGDQAAVRSRASRSAARRSVSIFLGKEKRIWRRPRSGSR